MTNADADYAAAVAALRTQSLPAYVSYTEEANARGLGNGSETPTRITVDSRTNRIVYEAPGGNAGNTPPTKRVFDPTCYQPTGEHRVPWNGRDILAIQVTRTSARCSSDLALTAIYADPSTFQLVGADGTESDDGVSTDISVHYDRFNGYTMPTSIQVHVHGNGLMFWVRQRAEVHYSNYSFDSVRRQAEQHP